MENAILYIFLRAIMTFILVSASEIIFSLVKWNPLFITMITEQNIKHMYR